MALGVPPARGIDYHLLRESIYYERTATNAAIQVSEDRFGARALIDTLTNFRTEIARAIALNVYIAARGDLLRRRDRQGDL